MLAFVHANATAVWPPTGIALAGLLVLGYRAWPAIFLGAFLVNISTPVTSMGVAPDHAIEGVLEIFLGNISNAGAIATSAGIATGNTLEGLLGAWLVNRFAGGRQAFDHPGTVFKFALLAGVASTMVSATVGVTTLALGGLASWADYGAIWWTWWLGDAAGALIKERIAVGESGRARRRRREIAPTAAMDFWRPLRALCPGKTFHRREWRTRDLTND